MRHRRDHRKLGRTSSHRTAMLRNMVTSLIEHEQIRTTDAKAREVRRLAERMITLGKRGDLHARRQSLRVVHGRETAAKLFGPLAERFRERAGGYTRMVKLARRPGDAARMAIVQLLPDADAAAATAPARGETAEKARSSRAAKAAERKAARPKREKTAASGRGAARRDTAKPGATQSPATRRGSTRAGGKPAGGKRGGRKGSSGDS
jgi:large subunit ribosomal protein L17